MLSILMHGEEEESITHKINELAFDAEVIAIPVVLLVLLTWFIWKQNQPPKGRHHKVDKDSWE